MHTLLSMCSAAISVWYIWISLTVQYLISAEIHVLESVKLWKTHGILHFNLLITLTFPPSYSKKCLKSVKWAVRQSLVIISIIYEFLK